MNDELIDNLPENPGVYIFENNGKIIYIGKAVSLKKRVRSYFQSSYKSPRISKLIKEIDNIKFIIANSENEALILENNLIKENQPKYNVELKDDKKYPYVQLTCQEKYPRIFLVRRKESDGAKYFGPFTRSKDLRSVLKLINQLFPLRICRDRLRDKKPCLYHSMRRCIAPCKGRINQKLYQEIVYNVEKILGGDCAEIENSLKDKMDTASKKKKFEEAAYYRDLLFSFKKINLEQKIDIDDWDSVKPQNSEKITANLKKILGLVQPPRTIEAFDISTISGKQSVGSLVCFKDGLPQKDEYRRFRIKTVAGIDDPKMIAEIVYRRYKRQLDEGRKIPDMILIDGGKTQVNAAYSVLHDLKLNVPVFGLAKKEEKLYRPWTNIPIILAQDSVELNYLKRIRDEAHRFAIKYHMLRRKKDFIPE